MTYADEIQNFSVEPVTLVVITMDFCVNTYGSAPCTATGSAGDECYNTRKTCQDPANYSSTTGKEYKFCLKKGVNPLPGENVRPYLMDRPRGRSAEIKPEFNLTSNADIKLVFADEPDTDIGIDPYYATRSYVPESLGTFWSKFFARNPYYLGRTVEIKEGVKGQAEANMQVRKYLLEQADGPDDGKVTLTCKDPLKMASRVKIPAATDGKLTSSIDNVVTTIPYTCSQDQYPASAFYVRIDDELIYVGTNTYTAATGTGSFTGCNRGRAIGSITTTAVTHNADAKIQLCYVKSATNGWDIIKDILVNYVGIAVGDIDVTGAELERDTWLLNFDFTGVISKPMDANKAIEELVAQLMASLWWDERAQQIIFKVFAPDPPSVATVNWDQTKNIIEKSVKVDRNEDARLSRVLVVYDKNTLDDDEKVTSYLHWAGDWDLDAEGADEYGQEKTKIIYSRWMTTSGPPTTLAARLRQRFRDPPAKINLDVWLKDSGVKTGDIVNLTLDVNPDFTGAAKEAHPYQVVQELGPARDGGVFRYRVMDTGWNLDYAVIAPNTVPDYTSATDEEKKYGFVGRSSDNRLDGGLAPGKYIF